MMFHGCRFQHSGDCGKVNSEFEANLSCLGKPSQHSPSQKKKRGGGKKGRRENRELEGKYGIGQSSFLMTRTKSRTNKSPVEVLSSSRDSSQESKLLL